MNRPSRRRGCAIEPVLVGVLAAACMIAPPAGARPPHVDVDDDRFSASVTLSGPAVFINPFGGTGRDWHIRSWVGKHTYAVTAQLYVNVSYIDDGWRFYERAADQDAEPLEVSQIDRSVWSCSSRCIYQETVGIDLDHATLTAHAATGYDVKLSAKSGDSLILSITPEQIALQLAAETREIAVMTGAPLPPDPTKPDLDSTTPIPPSGRSAQVQVDAPAAKVLEAARQVLLAQGYTLAPSPPGSAVLVTAPLHRRLTLAQADCGSKWAIPYLIDGRTHTNVSLSVSLTGTTLSVSGGVIGVLKTGMGVEDLPLSCTSMGVLEADVAKAIKARL